jgi:hypothetical protein
MGMFRENSSVPSQLRTYGDAAARQMYRNVMQHGGTTVDLATFKVPAKTDGYFVGGASGWNGERIPSVTLAESDLTFEQLRFWFAHMYAEHLTRQQIEDSTPIVGGYVGVWIDEGTVWFDASTWCETLEEAIELGAERGEIAVYSVAENGSLYVADYATTAAVAA